jgi:hypothetical protein
MTNATTAFDPDGMIPRAPEGTSPNTPHIWWIVGIYFAQVGICLVWLATFDWSEYMRATLSIAAPDGGSAAGSLGAMLGAVFTPAYFATMAISILGYWASVLLAYFDWKALKQRGVVRPFHWAFSFIASIVYVIGRSVVARRRTGSGIAPMWVIIVSYVLYMIVSLVITVVGMANMMNELSQYGFSY